VPRGIGGDEEWTNKTAVNLMIPDGGGGSSRGEMGTRDGEILTCWRGGGVGAAVAQWLERSRSSGVECGGKHPKSDPPAGSLNPAVRLKTRCACDAVGGPVEGGHHPVVFSQRLYTLRLKITNYEWAHRIGS